MNPNATVDYKNADLTIIVDVVKDTACCSVVPKFFHYKRYNLGELANAVKAKLQPGPVDKQEPGTGAETSSCDLQTEPNADPKAEPEVELPDNNSQQNVVSVT